ncbi:hypothetical protein B0A67_15700 [Flavobacterium aquidurense]|uniref:hypothetical protein n=1 Tax=Flavobacterium aquidurense TaxID=362413 RepID=UPI00091D106A|nr:hypothetical protein [Flavobacterium aquidurense]OXA70459.1 hypothetical protein B0A67_15700 [Flavobacterium aquidurense]SHH73096.1 hypothetical protein SAMN05444481_12537 [Flavobacterium frigidimaris]
MFKRLQYHTQKITLTTVSLEAPKDLDTKLKSFKQCSVINRIVGNPAFLDEFWFPKTNQLSLHSVVEKKEKNTLESLKKMAPDTTHKGEIRNITSFFGWICPIVSYHILCYKKGEQVWICWNYTFQIGGSLKGLYFLWFMKKKVNVSIEKMTCQAITSITV